jgi:uncharacterized membrane protein
LAPKKRPKNPSGLPGEQNVAWVNQQQRRQIVEAHVESIYSGPLPPPDVLIRYNDAVPGAAERILTMAERQSSHRIDLEKAVVDADIKRANRGLAAGIVVALAFGAGAFVLILSGHDLVGAVIGGGDLVALVGTFVYGTESRRRERQKRAEMFKPPE